MTRGALAIVVVVFAACRPLGAQDPGVQAVRVVSWPTRPAVDCDDPDVPASPEDPPWPGEDDGNPFARAYVHRRELDDLRATVRDLIGTVRRQAACIEHLRSIAP